ncbi:respiratory nitrate reductase subunit gamma [Rubrobacter tropicus]|uniref:Nitrate reductase-like protein NarX n=1 Tax=Rubrobacter tropicus TaxID=2653851 RepID=A0A6G8QDI0_9ACTN|nr:respiratory nitrate reductase subunit gamma [Rubrobacter tropicus]QIN84564.1 respiratory nitrate reductase subunit gamma [Rubrobacter tropicus]
MNLWEQFLWVIFPYLSLMTFVLGHVYRYRYDQYGWTPKSSQILERRILMWGVLLLHWGLLFVFGGHVMGLLVPIEVYRAMGVSDHDYHLLSLWAGSVVGVVALIDILLLNLRRWFIGRIRSNTETIKFVTDALLLVVILLGMAATIGYRVYVSQYELQEEFEYRDTIGPWFRSLLYFSPQPELMVEAPLIFQLHTLSAFLLFALWPFSSLVHAWSVPLGYLRRSPVQYRSSNPQATLTRERARKSGKTTPGVEQSRRVE